MTQHWGLSVNAEFSVLNSSLIARRAVTGHDSSPGKENQTQIAVGNTGESGTALAIETIMLVHPEVSVLIPVFKQGMGRRKVRVSLCCPSSPLDSRGARHASKALCTLRKDKGCSLCTLSGSGRRSVLPESSNSQWPHNPNGDLHHPDLIHRLTGTVRHPSKGLPEHDISTPFQVK